VSPVAQLDVRVVGQLQVRLMDQGGGVQRVRAPLAPELRRRDLLQLLVERRQQALQGIAVEGRRGRRDLYGFGSGAIDGPPPARGARWPPGEGFPA
jgi:hypothetical protein